MNRKSSGAITIYGSKIKGISCDPAIILTGLRPGKVTQPNFISFVKMVNHPM